MAPDEQAKSLKLALNLLEKASVIHKIQHSDASGLPLKMGISENVFKLLFLDVGLVNYDLKLDYESILDIYQSQTTAIKLLHKGLISEQFVGQQLLAFDHYEDSELFYWLREGKSQNAEVDFLIQARLEIIPVEVKFGKSENIKSLFQFIKEKGPKKAIKFHSEMPSIEIKNYENISFELIRLPLYFAERLHDLVIA